VGAGIGLPFFVPKINSADENGFYIAAGALPLLTGAGVGLGIGIGAGASPRVVYRAGGPPQ
jgi:hypothetical protein